MGTNLRLRMRDQAETIRQLFGDGQPLEADQSGLSESVITMLRESMDRHEALTAVFSELDRVGVGMTVKHWSGNQWAIFLPDASSPGKFRYQVFQACGWVSHFTFQTLDEAVSDAFDSGFKEVAPRETLDQLASTVEWKKGCERLDLITQHNRGEISYGEMLDQFLKVDAKYASAA
ncbi:TPA: hypothetical protein ACP32N_005099 [Pseudomonas aeruginosa]